ncbi:MAG: preprotein translocase subunit SecE [Acidobacteriota bacterium]
MSGLFGKTIQSFRNAGARTAQLFRNMAEFIRETRKELNNVSWPNRQELTGTTIVVIVAVFFFGFFLWAVDLIVMPVVGAVLHWLSP